VRRAQAGALGLLFKTGDAAAAVDLHYAEVVGLTGINEDGGQGHVGAGGVVLVQHGLVVHFVDVIAGQDDHVLALLAANGIDVLVNGVGGAQVPVLAHALHGWQDLDELAQLPRHHRAPAFADVAVQRKRLVLGEDIHAAQVGVDAVGERDIDDAVVAAEGHGGLGAV